MTTLPPQYSGPDYQILPWNYMYKARKQLINTSFLFFFFSFFLHLFFSIVIYMFIYFSDLWERLNDWQR